MKNIITQPVASGLLPRTRSEGTPVAFPNQPELSLLILYGCPQSSDF